MRTPGQISPFISSDERDLLTFIGNTPLFLFRDESLFSGSVNFYLKAEWHNPGGSVKDRPVLFMLRAGESAG